MPTEADKAMLNRVYWAYEHGDPAAALEHLRDAGWVRLPEGHVVVPREPTTRMLLAGKRATLLDDVWAAMVEAAPAQAEEGGTDG